MNITLKITLVITIILGIGFWFQNKQQFDYLKKSHRQAVEEPLVDIAVYLANQVSKTYPDFKLLEDTLVSTKKYSFDAKIYDINKNKFNLRIYIVNLDGKVIFDNEQDLNKDYSQWNDVIQAKSGKIGSRSSTDNPDRPKESILYVSAPIYIDNKIVGSLTVGKPTESLNKQVASTYSTAFIYSALTFSLIAIVALLLLQLIIHPIRRLTKYVADIRDGENSTFPELPAGEIKLLGTTFEEMKIALEGKKYIEKYVQTLTHEIKSPITAITAAAEILSDDINQAERTRFTNIILSEGTRLAKFASNLLAITSIQNQYKYQSDQVNLSELFINIIREYANVIESKNLLINKNIPEQLSIHGDSFLLSKAIGNIISNAIDFSENGNSIDINCFEDQKLINISITDHGSGIPDWAIDKIFNHFFSLPRPDTNQRSSGLGLSLVKEIIELHHGKIRVESSQSGSTFTIELRRSQMKK